MPPDRLNLFIIAAQREATVEQVAAFCAPYAEFLAGCQADTTNRRALFLQLPTITDDESAGPRLGAAIVIAGDKCRVIPAGCTASGHQRKRRTTER
ncbi:MAG TPA: hypothetical protein VKQ29_17530 [Aliidongia sp.]|nr:hypothetical protein [Aliidongia sp.]